MNEGEWVGIKSLNYQDLKVAGAVSLRGRFFVSRMV